MARTKLFVSHSSRSQAAKLRLRALVEALGDAGYDVLWDGRFIESGDQWREKIHVALAECQAAVILFDSQALRSPWVLKEATILAWRDEREGDDFRLLPVRLGDVTVEDLQAKDFAPLLLGETQHVVSGEVADIVAAARRTIPAGLETPTLFDLLLGELADQLERLSGDRTMEQVAAARFPNLQFTAGARRNQVFADRLAREIFRTGPRSLSEAVNVLNAFGLSQNKSAAERILAVLAPMWVEPEAAVVLAARRTAAYALCSLRSNVFQDFTAEHYIERGHPRSAQWHVFKVEETNDGDRVTHVRERVREDIRDRFAAAEFHEEGEFAYVGGLEGPAFVLLPFVLDGRELADLADVSAHLTFVMYTDCRMPDRPSLEGALYLDPELPRQDEIAALTGRDEVAEFLKKLRG